MSISVSRFETDGRSYDFYDIGVSGPLRKRWAAAVSDPYAVIFPFDAACFGDSLWGDEGDPMNEQLMLWSSIANSQSFSRTHLIVIFTKVDKLTKALHRQSSLGAYESFFAELPETRDDALRGMTRKLMSLISDPTPGQEVPRRWVSFWHASIVESTTKMAEVAFSALEHLNQEHG